MLITWALCLMGETLNFLILHNIHRINDLGLKAIKLLINKDIPETTVKTLEIFSQAFFTFPSLRAIAADIKISSASIPNASARIYYRANDIFSTDQHQKV